MSEQDSDSSTGFTRNSRRWAYFNTPQRRKQVSNAPHRPLLELAEGALRLGLSVQDRLCIALHGCNGLRHGATARRTGSHPTSTALATLTQRISSQLDLAAGAGTGASSKKNCRVCLYRRPCSGTAAARRGTCNTRRSAATFPKNSDGETDASCSSAAERLKISMRRPSKHSARFACLADFVTGKTHTPTTPQVVML